MNTAKFWSVLEKGHYPFRAWPHGTCDSLLFCGCSFMSQYPRTTDKLVEVCRANGCGVAYDCCGNSVNGFGEKKLAARVKDGVISRVKATECKDVIFACPNCKNYLTPYLEERGIQAVTVYEKLAQWGYEPAVGKLEAGALFTPCPDRRLKAWQHDISQLVDLDNLEPLSKSPCCGLRPNIASQGPQRIRELDDRIFAAADRRTLYTYCASCSGQFTRAGYQEPVVHVLTAILGTNEKPDAAHAIVNRAKRKFDRKLEPLSGPDAQADGREETGSPQ